MATRKKAPPQAPRSEAEYTVVLEEMRAHFKVFGEALQGVRDDVQAFRGEVDRRFDQVDRRFDQVDGRFDQVDGRFVQVDGRFVQVDVRLGRVEGAIVEHGREIEHLRVGLEAVRGEVGEVRATVTRIEAALATKVDRDEVESIVQRARAR